MIQGVSNRQKEKEFSSHVSGGCVQEERVQTLSQEEGLPLLDILYSIGGVCMNVARNLSHITP